MTLYNNFLLKRGVGLFSRVGLFSGDYGRWIDDIGMNSVMRSQVQ